jgi:gluconokinase
MLPQIAPDALILALDVGSSSVRTMIFDRRGNALNGVFVQKRYSPSATPDGGSEIDAEMMCGLIFTSIDEALSQAGEHAGRIAAVVMDTLVGNVLGVGADGQPVTPIYTWADRRGGEMADSFESALDPVAYRHRTGCRVHTSYWPLRVLWLAAYRPGHFQRVAHWLTLGDYAYNRIFGQLRISLSMASWSGLLNRHTGTWDDETLAVLPIHREQLAPLSGAPFRGLSGAWAQRWPALKEAFWFPAIGDGVASNIGAGCTTPHQMALSIGTSGALRIIVPDRPAETPDGLFVYCVDESRSLIGGALSNAGNLYAWMGHVLQMPPDLLARVDKLPPDGHGLTVLPFLAGERAPGWNDNARAVFMGMTLDTGPEHLVRAGLEAVAYRFYQIARRLGSLQANEVICVASGAPVIQSPPWMQIIADVLNIPVYASLESEATIRGAVCLALGEDPAPRLGQVYPPRAEYHTIYLEAIARQEALYNRLLS